MDFVAVVDQAIALLRQRGRLTYRTLQLQFQLDAEHLAALTEDLIKGQRLAVDEEGTVLVWIGDAAAPPAPAVSSAPMLIVEIGNCGCSAPACSTRNAPPSCQVNAEACAQSACRRAMLPTATRPRRLPAARAPGWTWVSAAWWSVQPSYSFFSRFA